jgi:hypothetical protein
MSIIAARTISFPSPLLVWGIAFIYAVVLGLTLQKLILPLMPSLHAEHGLLQQDAIYFHTVAVRLAERILTFGWSEWRCTRYLVPTRHGSSLSPPRRMRRGRR